MHIWLQMLIASTATDNCDFATCLLSATSPAEEQQKLQLARELPSYLHLPRNSPAVELLDCCVGGSSHTEQCAPVQGARCTRLHAAQQRDAFRTTSTKRKQRNAVHFCSRRALRTASTKRKQRDAMHLCSSGEPFAQLAARCNAPLQQRKPCTTGSVCSCKRVSSKQ